MKKKFYVLINKKINKFNKKIEVPGDKSCSIRAILLASQCIGISKVKNLLESEDVLNCIKALKTSLKVKILKKKNIYHVYGNGLNSFDIKKKITKIYVGNSGTSARLLSGLLSTVPNKFYLYGDQSMNKRDFTRVTEPLKKIGAFFYPKNKKTLPLIIEGTNMPLAQKHVEKKGSAQIKGLILMAALSTPGITTIEEQKVSRNHTELFLKKIKADIKVKNFKKGNLISLKGQKNLHSFNYTVSCDPSSAAFLVALTLLTPGASLTIDNVLCNQTRICFIKILKKINAKIKIKNLRKVSGELVGSIAVSSSNLKPIIISKDVGKLIDELPIFFIIAALTKGVSKFKNIGDLKHKESNRLLESKKILSQAGIKCKITKNSMIIYGKSIIETRNKSIVLKTKGDHRISMSAAIFALVTGIKTEIKNFETVNTSFPTFISLIKNLGGKIAVK
jgi:3-phosphoshikimate 1-carboxyvinyltransferase